MMSTRGRTCIQSENSVYENLPHSPVTGIRSPTTFPTSQETYLTKGLHLKRTKNSLSHDDASLRTSLSLKELINISYLRLKKGRARYSIMQNPLAAFLLADTRYSGRKSPSLLNGVESHLHTNSPVIILESMMHTLFAF